MREWMLAEVTYGYVKDNPYEVAVLPMGATEPHNFHLPYGMDIYEFDLESGELVRLTTSDDEWDEHAHYSPDGNKIAWMSSTEFDIDWSVVETGEHFDPLMTELWIMDADGSHPQRLTYFNDPDHTDYLGKTIVSDSSWSPDGKSLAVLVAYETELGGLNSKIVIVELDNAK